MNRKPIDLKPGDRVRITLDRKFMFFNRRQFWFKEWSEYLKKNQLVLVFQKAGFEEDYFIVQKMEDARIVYVS